ARRHRARCGGGAADAWRCRFRRSGPGRRIAGAFGAQGLSHRRYHPCRRQQQIGLTTSPSYARSSPYPSDVGKITQAPIFHVNGDDPEAVVHVARIATEFRQRFKKDVIVDIFCYRRHGHNEADEPAFTQPIMYRAIAEHPTTRQLYAQRLAAEGVVTEAEAEAMVSDFMAHLDTQFEAAKGYRPNKADWLEGAWSGLKVASGDARRGETAVP